MCLEVLFREQIVRGKAAMHRIVQGEYGCGTRTSSEDA
jgi:hypothetical protein